MGSILRLMPSGRAQRVGALIDRSPFVFNRDSGTVFCLKISGYMFAYRGELFTMWIFARSDLASNVTSKMVKSTLKEIGSQCRDAKMG